MFWVLAIVMFGVMFMGAGLQIDPALMFLLFVLLMVWMSVKLMVGFLRWVTGAGDRPQEIAGQRRAAERLPRTCGDSRCGMVNAPHARYCARCGRALR